MTRLLTVLALLAAALTGCSLFGSSRPPKDTDRLVTPDHSVASPSGEYTASVEYGAEENGVRTWIPVIHDKSGKEVFRDDHDDYSPYSTRQKLLITWLSSKPAELWVYSGDVGTFVITAQPNGTWGKQGATAPEEITDLHR